MIERRAKDTLTAIEMDCGETLRFELLNGETRTLELLDTDAAVLLTNRDKYPEERHPLARTMYHFTCQVRIDGQPMTMERYVCSQETFYEPYVVNGLRIWFDGVVDIFAFVQETHGACRPSRQARFALQDMTIPICPQPVHPWCPTDGAFIDVGLCYNGDDPWMGPYLGFDAHGGLDIDHPIGTPIWAPFDLDDNYYFNSLAMGSNNNRWRALRTWPDGSTWTIQTHHMTLLTVPEHEPIAVGTKVADGAGVLSGSHDHSHFVFKVREAEPGEWLEVHAHIQRDQDGDCVVQQDGLEARIPVSYLVHRQRPDRDDPSVFLVPADFAAEQGLDAHIPDVLLDPWIVFWQAFEEGKQEVGSLDAHFNPLRPVTTGHVVDFKADDLDGDDLSYVWTFGDGGGAEGEAAQYSYVRPGVYPVTLTVSDGADAAAWTQHITVSGELAERPALALAAPDAPGFRLRPVQAMDVYGWPVAVMPRALRFTARPTRPTPDAQVVQLVNLGGGQLGPASMNVAEGADWLDCVVEGVGDEQTIRVSVDAAGLAPGRYEARCAAVCPDAVNGEQPFQVILDVPVIAPRSTCVVDDRDPGFYATPWFWVGHRFHRWEAPGYDGFYLVNGKRPREGEYARFTPDLAAGTYRLRLHQATPFDDDSRFQVRVRHAGGDDWRWITPAESRVIGSYDFAEGADGFVEIHAGGATGQVAVDAVVFERIAD